MHLYFMFFIFIFCIFQIQASSETEDLKDLSAYAAYEFQVFDSSQKMPANRYNFDSKGSVYKDFLLKDNPDSAKQKFAFKTISGRTRSPYIVIKLQEKSNVKKIYIQNCMDSNKQFMEHLVVWISNDQNIWSRIWDAPGIEDEWTIDLPKGAECRFIMIGTEGRAFLLSLNKVRIYGKPLL